MSIASTRSTRSLLIREGSLKACLFKERCHLSLEGTLALTNDSSLEACVETCGLRCIQQSQEDPDSRRETSRFDLSWCPEARQESRPSGSLSRYFTECTCRVLALEFEVCNPASPAGKHALSTPDLKRESRQPHNPDLKPQSRQRQASHSAPHLRALISASTFKEIQSSRSGV